MTDEEILWRAALLTELRRAERARNGARGRWEVLVHVERESFSAALDPLGTTINPTSATDLVDTLRGNSLRHHVVAGLDKYVAALRAAVDGPYPPPVQPGASMEEF